MKKLIFSLALLLMSVSAALAQTWDFSEDGVSESDKANLEADAASTTPLWTVENTTSNFRYKSKGNLTASELKANGAVLNYTDGLLFTTTADDAVRVDIKYSRIALNKVLSLTIPGLKAGYIVKVKCKTSNNKTARALTAKNITPATAADFAEAGSADAVTYTGTVTVDGDVVLTNNGGIYLYGIEVIDPNQETPDEPGAFHNVSASKLKNQMVLTVDGDTKYYDTSDVKASINQASGAFTVSSKDNAWFDTYVGKVSDVSFVKAQLDSESGDIDNSDKAKVSLKAAQSWFQSAFVEWLPYEGATTYNVYVKGGQYSDFTKIDYQLVRDYGTYGRADALGLKAGEYELKVVPVVNDKEVAEAANIATGLKVRAHDRSGFAFNTSKTPGAYNADGTLKSGAVVVYLTNDNIDKVTLDVQTSNKGDKITCTGLQNIINNGIKKGIDTRPFVFRMIGQIKTPSVADKGDIVIDMNGKDVSAGVTIEGVGNDAVADGWGIRLKGARYAEVSNIGFFNCNSGEGDNVGLQQDNEHIWVHNCDMFYGNAGSDADQIKGDGALDCKKSNYVTFSYNHFWDNGKCNLLGLSEGSTDYYITYHHNWYDHSDSRHPRVRYYSAHVYNNYYDGNAKYGVGSTLGSSVFVENNYFRNTNKPMMISQQGTDIKGNPKGTFSGEDGGIIKAYGNVFADMKSLRFVPYSDENQTEFDAYVASSRDEQVPASVTSKKGGNKYNNFDTNSSLFYSSYVLDKAEDVPAVVAGQFGAGRVQHGDFQWTFKNSVDDAEYEVNAALKKAVSAYKTSLVKIFGGENINVPGTDPTPDPGTDPTPDPGTDPTPTPGTDTPAIEGTVLVTFTGSKPSGSVVTVSGKYATDKGTATIDGTDYTTCVKMESATNITVKVDKDVTATFYFANGGTASLKVDGSSKISGTVDALTNVSSYTTTLTAGSHTITKGDIAFLFGIKLVPITTE